MVPQSGFISSEFFPPQTSNQHYNTPVHSKHMSLNARPAHGCLWDSQTGPCVILGPLMCESWRPSALLSLGCMARVACLHLVHLSLAATSTHAPVSFIAFSVTRTFFCLADKD